MEETFSVWSVPGLYNEERLSANTILTLHKALIRSVMTLVGCEFRVAFVRSKNLVVAEAGDSSGTQRKGNVRRWKPLSNNG
jgi:hypothetical protein